MTEVTSKVRKWGNSYGIIIPHEVLKKKGISEGEEIDAILIKKANVLKETFGTMKSKKPVEQLMKEVDKELYDL